MQSYGDHSLDDGDGFGSIAVMELEKSALVLFSGGQDSTTCLAYALENYAYVETIGFNYGQRHSIEMDCRAPILKGIRNLRKTWHDRLGDDQVLDLPALAQIGGSALIGDGEIRMMENGLPSSFVPGRNLLFLTYAAGLAYRRGLNVLVGGMCESDYSGYPDCRRDTLDALTASITKGMEYAIAIDTPLMYLTKAESWKIAEELGGQQLIDMLIEESHSCYMGTRDKRHAWGYGCGGCPACELRQNGFEAWLAAANIKETQNV